MRFWYLSHKQPGNAQLSLCIGTASTEPLLFTQTVIGSGYQGSYQNWKSGLIVTCMYVKERSGYIAQNRHNYPLSQTLINQTTIKESTSTLAPIACISYSTGCWNLPVK